MVNSAQAKDLLKALDPASFMASCGLEPDDKQVEYLRSTGNVLLLCTRQWGKSTTTGILAAHQAKYYDDSLTLLLSPSLRQSGELAIKVRYSYYAEGAAIPLKKNSPLQLEYENGSRIVSLPGKEETVRGFSDPELVIFDEAARVPDELYYSIRPMLAVSGGRVLALSTPFGKRGWFHKEWTEGGDSWTRIIVTAPECPRISPEFLEEERKRIPSFWYRQEYMCEFVQTLDSVFNYDQVMEAMDDSIEPLFVGGV